MKTMVILLALTAPAKHAPDYTPVPKVETVGRICTTNCTTCPPRQYACQQQCTTTCF